jgi:hypothetical protein
MAVTPNPPYSPDLAPCVFFLFPKIKLELKERRFDTIEDIQAESLRVIDTLGENGFQECSKKGDGGTGVYMLERILRGWWRPIGLMVSFVIFTASVRNILDTTRI